MECVDTLVLGAGPAGLQLGYYLAKSGRSYVILERGAGAGHFFETYPRHRKLISINKVNTGTDDPELTLRFDWNSLLNEEGLLLKDYTRKYWPSAEDFLRYLRGFATRFALNIRYSVDVERVSRSEGGGFTLQARDGQLFHAQRLVVASGVSREYEPPIPGLELCERYSTVSIDAEAFTNQRVLILGKGNSAFETADHLSETAAVIHVCSPDPLKMAWRTHFVGHLRAVNNNLLDTYQLKLQNAILDATVERIERRGQCLAVTFAYTHAGGERETLLYDHVIACTGFRFDASPFDASCRPDLDDMGKFPTQTSAWESSNVQDLYFAGTLMQFRDYKKHQSGFIHGFRYNVRALFQMLEQRYHGVPISRRTVAADPEALAEATLARVNLSSGLWQQTGFLADCIVPDDDGGASYYDDLPLDWLRDAAPFTRGREFYAVTIEFGEMAQGARANDPFAQVRVPRHAVERAHESTFLHPVVRRYRDGKLLSTHHVIEDLAAEWIEDEHRLPLIEYFSGQTETMEADDEARAAGDRRGAGAVRSPTVLPAPGAHRSS